MAKPNYAFAKRQRDLAKKQKKDEKKLKKTTAGNDQPEATQLEDTQATVSDADKPDA